MKTLKFVVMGALMLLLASGVAVADTKNCTGGLCTGTSGNDTMYGSEDSDEMKALEGNDTVYGYGGTQDDLEADNIFNPAEGGDDKLYGGDGEDILRTYSGSDLLVGGGGVDLIEANSEWEATPPMVDTFKGGRGADIIRAADNHKDIINCGRGKDTVEYDQGLDKISYCETKQAL